MKVISAYEAAQLIEDGVTLGCDGFVGIQVAEEIYTAIEKRTLEEGSPKDLTLFHISGQGDSGPDKGLCHFKKEGTIKRIVGGHWNILPSIRDQISENKIEGINLPQGTICHMIRDMAAGRPGTITNVGLQTFVDPRVEGGKVNDAAKASPDEFVELIELDGREYLRYKPIKLDVCILRGTYADEKGNISLEKEAVTLNATSLAQAAHNQGGIVIVQVLDIVKEGQLDPRLVKIPGIYVDYVVVAKPENHWQTYGQFYNPAFSGEKRVPTASVAPLAMDVRKIITRRCAMELKPNSVLNLGVGMPEGVAIVAAEEGIAEGLNLSVEAGVNGGIAAGGPDFGAATNPDAILDEAYQFDFYDGGGIDIAFLGIGQCDAEGNINVSKFGTRYAGCGGFINITQNTNRVIFCGSFTAGGTKLEAEDEKLKILNEGKIQKFIPKVDQITFSGNYAREHGQKILYVTERAVFEMREEGMTLIEIAPGVDLEKDVLANMGFKPVIADDLKIMDERIFRPEKMGLTV